MNKMQPQPASLDARITAAFAPNAHSEDFATLIEDVEAAANDASGKAAAARTRALDPVIAAVEVTAARREMEDATFRSDRLQTAVKRLNERLREVQSAEENRRRQLAYDKTLAARDALAKELAAVYPPLAAQLTELMQRIAANDREVAHVNNRLPEAAERILVAELVGRGMQGFVNNGVTTPSLLAELRLPAFHRDQYAPYSWHADGPGHIQLIRV